MERKIGEIFEYKGEWYQCVLNEDKQMQHCYNCHIAECASEDLCREFGKCGYYQRSDGKNVLYKKLEKVGEPFSCNYHGDRKLIMMQEYKAYNTNIVSANNIPMYVSNYKHKRIAIELKQNQKDMEEKKSNLKPFSLEAAKAGKPVCTRDGRSARIVCFDRKGYNMFPIVALIMNGDRENDIYTYRPNGTWYNSGNESDKDLMMLPEKKEGWVNVIKNQDNYYYCKGVFDTEEYARNNEANYPGLAVATVKIEWEE